MIYAMHTKKLIVLVILVFAGILLSGIIDRFLVTPTTQSEIDAAISILSSNNIAIPPGPFVYDGCSLFFDSLPLHDFTEGCFAHDVAYWAGGTKEERKAADRALKDSVAETGPVGMLMQYPFYIGVRLFGTSFIAHAFNVHWGFGWD